MSTDKRTRAGLIAELSKVQADMATARARLDQLTRKPDVEARALEECVHALRKIEPHPPTTYHMGVSSETRSIARVLSYLAARFGLPDPMAAADAARREADEQRQRAEAAESRLSMIRGNLP